MTEKNIAKICEMFTSVQGEGPYVGCKQLFIRFCGCNLNCDYCDTTEFKNAVFISVGGSFDTISGEIKKAPNYFMENGLDWFYRIITKPWRYLRLLRLAQFFLTVLIKKIFRKKRCTRKNIK